MAAKPTSEQPPTRKLDVDPRDPVAMAALLKQLTPAQTDAFLGRLERIMLKKKVQAWGYLLAALVFALGVMVGLTYWALVQTWASVMLMVVPVALAALVLIGFGKWANRL
ncbi:MAG: hypothetical protein IPL79_03035 [Myxococcales bacterium]|nr:hypothetical protein [Myxococcales bacterium]